MDRNSRNIQRYKRHAGRRRGLFPALFVVFLLFLYASGCIYDNREDCPQGIDVRLYSKTSCSQDTVYPEVSDLTLCVFDHRDRLVSCMKPGNMSQLSTFHTTLEAENGYFTVIAWAGLDSDDFDLSLLRENITSKSDLLFRIQRASQKAVSLEGKRVYYGESPAVFLPDPAQYGSVFEATAINLREITNRLRVSVEGLPDADDYEIVIESANGSMNMDGSIAADSVIEYTSQPVITDGVLDAVFTVLKLETGYNNTLIIRNKRIDEELYRGDLLGTLLLKNPEVNLACDNDFTIRFTTGDQCACGTYMIVEIRVNDWLVHSYGTEL